MCCKGIAPLRLDSQVTKVHYSKISSFCHRSAFYRWGHAMNLDRRNLFNNTEYCKPRRKSDWCFWKCCILQMYLYWVILYLFPKHTFFKKDIPVIFAIIIKIFVKLANLTLWYASCNFCHSEISMFIFHDLFFFFMVFLL